MAIFTDPTVKLIKSSDVDILGTMFPDANTWLLWYELVEWSIKSRDIPPTRQFSHRLFGVGVVVLT